MDFLQAHEASQIQQCDHDEEEIILNARHVDGPMRQSSGRRMYSMNKCVGSASA